MTEEVKKIMTLLKCTEAEAEDVIKCDKAIDKGERMDFDLSPEAEKEAKKYANSRTKKKPTVYNFDDTNRKKKKDNPTKATVIEEIAKLLTENGEISAENVEIVNKECEIDFTIDENSYYIKLTQRRKSKN